MADNSFLIRKSATLSPQASIPTNPVNGDFYYDSSANTFIYYDNGKWINLASRSDVASATDLTSTNFTAAVVQNSFVRVTGSTVSNLHGLTASTDGKQIIVYNQSTVNDVIKFQSATETTPANRIITMTGTDLTLAAGMMAMFVYDASQARWICDTFAPPQSAINTYPSFYVTNQTDLINAMSGSIPTNGGVILILNNITVTTTITVPNNVKLLARDRSVTITLGVGGTFSVTGNEVIFQELSITSTTNPITYVTVTGNDFQCQSCDFNSTNATDTNTFLSFTGSYSDAITSIFRKTLYPSTCTALQYNAGSSGNTYRANEYTT